jgi:hypothetical protein
MRSREKGRWRRQLLAISQSNTVLDTSLLEPRSIHLREIGLRYVHARVFTSAKIYYYRMQWPKKELVFPLFPTLLFLIKKKRGQHQYLLYLVPTPFPPWLELYSYRLGR